MEKYLDLSPMLQAIREQPGEFEMEKRYLHHIPSGHRLAFDAQGNARVYARCACSELAVQPEQSAEMKAAIASWEETYWRPLVARKAAERRVAEINRAFAEHFRRRSATRKWWDNVVAAVLGREKPFSLETIDPKLPEDSDLAPPPGPHAVPMEHMHRSIAP
jgi:hypothetical protein